MDTWEDLTTWKVQVYPISMRVEILFDTAVSPNLAAQDISETCAFPLSTVFTDGSVGCVYRSGSSKHSHDGVLVMQKSQDGGVTWAKASIIFDGRSLDPVQTVLASGLCQTQEGSILVVFSAVEGLRPGVYMFSGEGRSLNRKMSALISRDTGETWESPVPICVPTLSRFGLASKPFTLPDGVICLPLEYRAPSGPNSTTMMFSEDHGASFGPPITVALDPDAQLNLCDARFDRLPDGRLITLLWTFLQENEQTIDVHQAFSSDNGRTWTPAESIGFVGQITAPLAMPTGEVIAVSNYRLSPQGIRLWLSSDGGRQWDIESPIQMWDAARSRLLGEPIEASLPVSEDEGVWEALQTFTFGTPDLLSLQDGSLLMTYYGTVNHITHIRACRFKIDFDRA